ncbi:MAG: hypothetical protein HYR72_19910 [Deltaproteobacteria bacterium]|nr:hypothetical protein [Deltaproteobacteria bacterium]MBI3386832.1 hypothetical protein [Deltaproteobacteria bacterium]
MRLGFRFVLISIAAVAGLAGCGGGSSSSTEFSGGLTMRALWEQPKAGGASAAATHGGFGPDIPRAVKSVAIRVDPSIGARRCIAVDPRAIAVDPDSGQRQVVFEKLHAGPAMVTIFGSADDIDAAREHCEGRGQHTPSFRSDPHEVLIRPLRFNDAGDIEVYAIPFLLNLDPPAQEPPASIVFRTPIRLTIADAISGIDPASIHVSPQVFDARAQLLLSLTPCDDAGATPCSAGGEFGVTGFHVEDTPPLPGPQRVGVVADNLATPPRELDFSYEIVVQEPTNTGVLHGTVINCLTGTPLAATAALLKPEVRQTDAGSDGLFRFDQVPFGDFELQASATGFITGRISGTLSADNPDQNVTIPICPPIALRTVLTWGSGPPAPADLDAHLRGPAPGTSVAGAPVEFNLFFANDTVPFPSGGKATLDIDSRNFNGPETMSVTELAPGMYHYCVHDFSNRTNPQSTAFMNSNGRVQVFLNNQQVSEFMPPDGAGNVWEVFAIDTTQTPPRVTAVNRLGAEATTERVCRRITDRDGDGLTDAQEAALGTDPDLSDTNANGLSDGEDVIEGNSPLPPPTVTLPPITSTATPTPTPTPTATVTFGEIQCGDGVTVPSEECDDGGTCIGGSNAGAPCTFGPTCDVGVCTPTGGDGCAANCTNELSVPLGFQLSDQTCGIGVGCRPFNLVASGTGLWRIGKPNPDGSLPIAIRADEVSPHPLSVQGLGCACLRGIPVPEFGLGNAGHGVLYCGAFGFSGVDVNTGIDHTIGVIGANGFTAADCLAPGGSLDTTHPGVCNGPATITQSGQGPAGSAVVRINVSFGFIADGGSCATETDTKVCRDGANPGTACTTNSAVCVGGGTCVPAKGGDGIPCNGDDPEVARGTAGLSIFTTGTASATITDTDNQPGVTFGPGQMCGNQPCVASGTGAPANCVALMQQGTLAGMTLVAAAPTLDIAQQHDIISVRAITIGGVAQ